MAFEGHQSDSEQAQQQKPSNMKCLSLEEDFGELLETNEQVYLFMAAKSAGSSLKAFANQCMGDPTRKHHPDNFVNREDQLLPFLLSSLQPPKLVANHLLDSGQPMIDLIQYGSRRSLIVYVYQEETDRLLSAIKQVVLRLCDSNHFNYKKYFGSIPKEVFGLEKVKDESCSFDEKPFVEQLIQKKIVEVNYSVPAHLTCELWDDINASGPNIVFVHYKQVDALQAKLAAHFWPNVESQRENVDELKKRIEYKVRLQKGGEALLGDWLDAKKHTMEYFLKLSGSSCKANTRRMEDTLLACPGKAVQVFPKEERIRWKQK